MFTIKPGTWVVLILVSLLAWYLFIRYALVPIGRILLWSI